MLHVLQVFTDVDDFNITHTRISQQARITRANHSLFFFLKKKNAVKRTQALINMHRIKCTVALIKRGFFPFNICSHEMRGFYDETQLLKDQNRKVF